MQLNENKKVRVKVIDILSWAGRVAVSLMFPNSILCYNQMFLTCLNLDKKWMVNIATSFEYTSNK